MNWIDKLIAQKVPAYYLGFVTLWIAVFGFTQAPKGKYVRFYLGDQMNFALANNDSLPRFARSARFESEAAYVELCVEQDTVRFSSNLPVDQTSRLILDQLMSMDEDYIYYSKQERDKIGRCLAKARQKLAEKGELFECK